MPKIKTMSPHLADLIAAGEVVERPGSVIKELVENSIDAGANAVTIEIRNGGMSYIRVTDNGCGMSPEDAETAFLRHATSKLTSEHELEAIKTLGFRGEALAATSAVSKIELMTRESEAEAGVRLILEGGTVVERSPAGCPEGTTMIVRDLFFNTPARLKFMKTDRAEGSFVSSVAMRIALSRPDVSIRYIKDGREEFHTPGDNRRESCIYSLMGRDFALGLIKAATDDGTVRVEGFVSAPKDARGSRSNQFFFVNGRCVKSKLLQSALEQAYKNNLFQGRFPSCILYIEMSPSLVDVNVHPAKTEVKFLKERQVFDGVYYAALSALEGAGEAPVIEISRGTQAAVKAGSKNEAKPSMASYSGFTGVSSAGGFSAAAAKPKDNFFRKIPANSGKSYLTSYSGQWSVSEPQQTVFNDFTTGSVKEGRSFVTPEVTVTPPASKPEYVFIGEAMNTYIIVQQGDELLLIDKHAAHERMIFDRLRAGGARPMSQPLLEPCICRLNNGDAEIILENLSLLEPLGYEIDSFGDDRLAVRAVPADTDASDLAAHIEELAGIISSAGRQGLDAAREEILHSVACKAAIKAGKPSARDELTLLADKVLAGEIKYCPHGRPVAISFTKYELDRKFKRT